MIEINLNGIKFVFKNNLNQFFFFIPSGKVQPKLLIMLNHLPKKNIFEVKTRKYNFDHIELEF